MNSDLFSQIDRVIHERVRLAIMSSLAASRGLTFRELRDLLKLTDGNLSVHLRTLQEAGYVSVTKSFVDHKPHSTIELTVPGKTAFRKYLDSLESIVKSHRPGDPGSA